MRYVILVGVLGLALALDLAVLIAASDDGLAAFDPHHPATVLPILAGGARNIASGATVLLGELRAALATPYRGNGSGTRPTGPPAQ